LMKRSWLTWNWPSVGPRCACICAGWKLAPPSKLTLTVLARAANRRKLLAGAAPAKWTAFGVPACR